ncbi:MAG: 4Fe-4S dicluster domain-containing protein [Dysgonamonadaceae bacterium]|jgi:ferredoxin|nr:4Fe-4S dicluster domain-containing protein [Dysgonamonadaceae bacterium]
MERKNIRRQSLMDWLEKVRQDGRRIYAPVSEGERTDFRYIRSVNEISMNHVQTTRSAKAIAFPRTEKLFSYTRHHDGVSLQEPPLEAPPETLLFGLHPCDAAGFKPLSSIFNRDTNDAPFNERMCATTLVALSCTQCDAFCFCTSTGGGPGRTEGSDLLLTPTGEDYLVEIVTPKGKALVEKYAAFFEPAPDNVDKAACLAHVPKRFDLEDLTGKLSAIFPSHIWEHQSARCLGCGACAFVCPTCACFDIQEHSRGRSGDRLRCWDSCGFSLFTLHTSGHNPRREQSQRWRQRLLHKFSYMPKCLSVTGCTGCGRCSRACPVDMNLADHLTEISHP